MALFSHARAFSCLASAAALASTSSSVAWMPPKRVTCGRKTGAPGV